MTEDKMTEVKGKEKKKKRDLPVLKIVQEDPASCFVQLSNKMNSSKIDPTVSIYKLLLKNLNVILLFILQNFIIFFA